MICFKGKEWPLVNKMILSNFCSNPVIFSRGGHVDYMLTGIYFINSNLVAFDLRMYRAGILADTLMIPPAASLSNVGTRPAVLAEVCINPSS